MKIESSKTNQADKKSALTEKSGTNFQTPFKVPEKADLPAQPARFAKVLEEAHSQTLKSPDAKPDRKTGRGAETAETDKKDENNGAIENRDQVKEKDKRHGGGGGGDEQTKDRERGFGVAPPMQQNILRQMSEPIIPAARSILHVADLERIVSSVRAQNQKNVEQIVIALKHSVLEGLQIKLTIDGDGKLVAEFLAANEQIKNHLTARKQEISQILQERGVNISNLDVRQGSNFEKPATPEKNDSAGNEISTGEEVDETAKSEDFPNQISYRI